MKFEYKIIDDFISSESSNYLISFFENKLKPSNVIGDSYLRNSDDFYIDINEISDEKVNLFIKDIKSKISTISNLPEENQELLTIIRYNPGQYFKPHLDAFHDYDEFEIEELLGGQRVSTFIICLQSADDGGETVFNRLNQTIKLEKNQCIYWNNVDIDGEIIPDSLHSGEPPKNGKKWILTCWIRERKYYAIDRRFAKQIIQNYSKQILINTLESL